MANIGLKKEPKGIRDKKTEEHFGKWFEYLLSDGQIHRMTWRQSPFDMLCICHGTRKEIIQLDLWPKCPFPISTTLWLVIQLRTTHAFRTLRPSLGAGQR